MTTLLRDVIHIPEQVFQGDFVLKLTDGVEKAARYLRRSIAGVIGLQSRYS